jgi:hypothetical protein
MNHWGAWIVQEDVVHTHLEPPLALVADAITSQYLRPVMEQMGRTPEQIANTVVWFSVEHLISRPSKGDDARVAHSSGTISDEALRDALGFTEADAPESSLMPEASKIALDMVKQNPALMQSPGLAVIVEQLTALLAGQTVPEPEVVAEPIPEADAPVEPEPVEEGGETQGPPTSVSPPDAIAASTFPSRRARQLVPTP